MKHYNPSIADNAVRLFNLKGEVLEQVADFVQPVIEIQNRVNIAKVATATNATSATVYTTPTDKDFYVTAVVLSTIKDVTSTSTTESITCTIDGVSSFLASIASLSLTVQTATITLSFVPAIKIDRGTNINVANSTNVANITSKGVVIGYTVETTKGV